MYIKAEGDCEQPEGLDVHKMACDEYGIIHNTYNSTCNSYYPVRRNMKNSGSSSYKAVQPINVDTSGPVKSICETMNSKQNENNIKRITICTKLKKQPKYILEY